MGKPGVTGGDGSSSPFGDGKGGIGMAKAPPNDFITNPGGNNRPQGPGFVFDDSQKVAPEQTTGEDLDKDQVSASPSGRFAYMAGDKSANPQASGADRGVGTIGNGAKPFKMSGG